MSTKKNIPKKLPPLKKVVKLPPLKKVVKLPPLDIPEEEKYPVKKVVKPLYSSDKVVKKLFTPQGIIQPITNNKNNKTYDKDVKREFSPKFSSKKFDREWQYEYFIHQFTNYSKKHTDKTMTLFTKKIKKKPWDKMSGIEKYTLFIHMIQDIFSTFQRDFDTIETFKHEFSERELNLAEQSINKIFKNYKKSLMNNTETARDILKVDNFNKCCDILTIREMTNCLDFLNRREQELVMTEIDKIKKNKNIDEKWTGITEEERNKIYLEGYYQFCSNTNAKKKKLKRLEGISHKNYLKKHQKKFKTLYNETGHGEHYESIPKNMDSILEDVINNKIQKSYLPKFDVETSNITEQIDKFYNTKKWKWRLFTRKILSSLGLGHQNINSLEELEELKEKVKEAYSDNYDNLSKHIQVESINRIHDDIFIRNSTNLCFPHGLKIDVATKTLPIIKDILDKDVLYTAIQDGSNMKDITNIFIAPSEDNEDKYLREIPGRDEISKIKNQDMYLHVYTFTDFILNSNYHAYFETWYTLETFSEEKFKTQPQHDLILRVDSIKNTKIYTTHANQKFKKELDTLIQEIEFNTKNPDKKTLITTTKRALGQTLLNDQVFKNMFKDNFITYINKSLFSNKTSFSDENRPDKAEKIINHIFEIYKQNPIFLTYQWNPNGPKDRWSRHRRFYNLDDYRMDWIFRPKRITYKYSRWGFMTKVSNGDYKNKSGIIEPPMLEESNDFIDITKKNKTIITYNKKDDLVLSPHSTIYYMLKKCLETEKGKKSYEDGIIVRMGVNISDSNSHYMEKINKITRQRSERHPDYDNTNHRNSLIIDAKNRQAIEVYIFDMNYSQPDYIRDFINRALKKCEEHYNKNHENKIKFMKHLDNDRKEYLVKVITGKTLGVPEGKNLHGGSFDYVDGGICASIAYYTLILWSRYHSIFGSFPNLIKYIYDIIENSKKKRNASIEDDVQRKKNTKKETTKERNKRRDAKIIRKRNTYLWEEFESGVLTFMIFCYDLFQHPIVKTYIENRKTMFMKKWEIDFNKKISAGGSIKRNKKLPRTVGGSIKRNKKLPRTVGGSIKRNKKLPRTVGGDKKIVRKHRGIIQTGVNKGKLRKGYKYTGKRLKNGSAEIKKV